MAEAQLRYENVPKVTEAIPIRKKTVRRILNPKSGPESGKIFEISAPDYSFGPFYYPESKSSAEAKDKAWKRILEKEGTNEENTKQSYLSAMRSVEKEARAAYGGDSVLVDFTESEFRWMMIRDGCFFLQLTMSLLKASGTFGYPDDDPIFGEKQSTKTSMALIKSMFLVGNQIPLVVLNKLMNQKFFQSIKSGERPSDMLSKQILYDLIVDPAKHNGKKYPQTSFWSKLLNLAISMAFWSIHVEKPSYYSSHLQKPSDLLHGLQLFLLGPATDKAFSSPDDDSGDWSDGEFENGDIEAGIKPKPLDNHNPDPNPNPAKTKEVLEKNKQLNLSNLTKKGMIIWDNIYHCGGGGGSRGIEFKNRILWFSLFLPPLKVNRDTNVLFTNLKYYEIVHQQKEVRSYINFLANLVSTYEDVNVLVSNKIIDKNTRSEDKDRFLETLENLSDKEAVLTTHHHQFVMGQVKDFNWQRFKHLAIVISLLTFIQTVFTVLGYFSGHGDKRLAAAWLQYVNVPKVIEAIPVRNKNKRIISPKSDPKIGKYFEISTPDYSFGPFYHPESKSSIEAKDKAWKKILVKEGPDEENTIQRYVSAIKRVEKEARAAYGGDAALVGFTESEFRWMMIIDSCLFLQLTLSLLNNASPILDYPAKDPIFWKKQSMKSFMGLIKSMFLVGNQIPLVVLNNLMNLKFFRPIVGVQLWERPSDLLSKRPKH